MQLVNFEGRIYRMSVARLRAYLSAVAFSREPKIETFGEFLGLAMDVTGMDSGVAYRKRRELRSGAK